MLNPLPMHPANMPDLLDTLLAEFVKRGEDNRGKDGYKSDSPADFVKFVQEELKKNPVAQAVVHFDCVVLARRNGEQYQLGPAPDIGDGAMQPITYTYSGPHGEPVSVNTGQTMQAAKRS